MADKVVFCVNCKFCYLDDVHWCTSPKLNTSFVTGKTIPKLCHICRETISLCSKEGFWFEPKNKEGRRWFK